MIYRVSLLLEALLIIKCIYDVYGQKFKFSIELAVFLISDMILMSAILEGFLPNWCSMFMYAVIIIFTIVKFGFNIKKLFINLAFVIIVLSVLQAICAVLIYNILQGKFEEEKSFCSNCPIHCYKNDMKVKIKKVMKFSGPWLIIYSPIQLIKHIFE